MNSVLKPGDGFIYMKIGTHAQESLESIVARKRQEIAEAGFALWGYGGNTCHPLRVQPFARDYVRRSGTIYLVMEPMNSRHFAPPARAREQSADGLHWSPIPDAINVLGSRWAMAIGDLEEASFRLPLEQTRVAVGGRAGRPGDQYIGGHVDKACLELVGPDPSAGPSVEGGAEIGLVARMVEPFAVLLR